MSQDILVDNAEAKMAWPSMGETLISKGPNFQENAWIRKGSWSPYAEGFYQSAHLVCHQIIEGKTPLMDVLIYPIVFNFRQFLECQLKDMVILGKFFDDEIKVAFTHRLLDKWHPLREIIEDMWPDEDRAPVDSVENTLKEFEELDPTSEQFRYPFMRDGSHSLHELSLINVRNLHNTMEGVYNFLGGVQSSMIEAKRSMDDFRSEERY